MKLINFILFFTIFFYTNNNSVISLDPCQVPIQVNSYSSCGNIRSKFVVYKDLYYFDSIEVTPYVQVVNFIDYGYISWELKNGVNYTISYRYKNCSNYISQSFVPQGMYYELLSEPLCPMTLFNYTVHNWGNDGSSFNLTGTPPIQSVSNQMGSCVFNFYVFPKSDSKGALQSGAIKISNPTCGFNNGSISIDLTKGYSNSHLFFENDISLTNEIMATSPGVYNGLNDNGYYLFIYSTECGTEKIKINLMSIFTPMEIKFEYVPNLYQDSVISLSLASGPNGVINNTNVMAYFPDSDYTSPLGEWTNTNASFGGKNTNYGYYYYKDFSTNSNKPLCYYSDSIRTLYYYPNINFTVERNESCSNNVTITFYPPTQKIIIYDADIIFLTYPMENNVLSIPYNKNLYIMDQASASNIFYTTYFTSKPSYIIVESSNGTGCWKTYNITIGNYENYRDLKLLVSNNNNDNYYFYPVNGVFVNVPANFFKIYYTTGDCQTPSYFVIDKSDYSTPMDNITIEYTTLKAGNCTSPTVFRMSVNTTIGSFTSEDIESYSQSKKLNFNLPNSLCSLSAYFDGPKLIDESPINFNILSNINCNYTSGNVVNFTTTNGYNMGVLLNGVSLYPQTWNNINNCYYLNTGVNDITIQYSGPNGACFGFKTINIQPTIETPIVQVSPVTNCTSGNGKITILNYQNFSTLGINYDGQYQSIYSGIIENLNSVTYTLLYSQNQACSSSIMVNIPTSEQIAQISTSIINNPTCYYSSLGEDNADGSIKVNLKVDNVQINNFNIENQNPGFTFANGIYEAAGFGINSLKISYGACVWNRDVNVTVVNTPQFSLQKVLNDTCNYASIYKLVNNNSNVVVSIVNGVSSGGYVFYQNEYYFQPTSSGTFIYYLSWNTECNGQFSQDLPNNENYNFIFNNNIIEYQIIKADNCTSLKIDLIITNMNLFSFTTLSNKSPTSINSTHAVFKNLPPSSSYNVEFSLLNGCTSNQEIGFEELSTGYTKESLNVNITNDICYSGKGSINLLSTMDTENYYYNFIELDGGMGNLPITNFLRKNNDSIFSNLKTGTYNITRTCKSIANCFISTSINIKSDNPSIESVIINHSYGKLNNGSVEVKLNYNSSYPITYELVGTKLSNNNGKFINLSPKDYQLKITITDRMCPVTLSKTFTVKLISLPSTDSSEELSTSSFAQTNLLLLFSILILTIIFL
ncbi:hypothetical protein RB653_009821 [Dictyostelium firmibasis]|uniref:Uncharacterized protein n=1 Tax=Dictyostelium firmibasis TaxID=79012 RepID=A0AAN7TT24_9MYCE